MTGGHFNRNEVCVWNWNILNSWFSGWVLLHFHNSIFQLVSQFFIQKKRDEENKNKNCLKTHWKTVSCRSSHNFEHIALERTRYRRTYCGHFHFVAYLKCSRSGSNACMRNACNCVPACELASEIILKINQIVRNGPFCPTDRPIDRPLTKKRQIDRKMKQIHFRCSCNEIPWNK